jgi:GT2 family glycosyltransferase
MRMLRSIDYPVGKVMIINNGEDIGVASALDQLALTSRLPLEVVKPEKNLGCAASWNLAMSENPQADYWLFIGNDIELHRGDLEKIDQFITEHPRYVTCPANWGHSLFAVTRVGLDQIGYFDENFYPAYHEDQDHMYRVGPGS